MSFGSGKSSITLEEILSKTTEANIISFYLGVPKIPCIIHSPLRKDKKPSFGLYSLDGKRIYYNDFSTGDSGGLFDLLSQMWGMSYIGVLEKIYTDLCKFNKSSTIKSLSICNISSTSEHNKSTDLQCKVREWRDYDIEYWKSYGISLKWLKYAEVYPISHKIIIKEGNKYVLTADKYAYVYVERKENHITLKIYQPFNKLGYKWANKNDKSVIGLWTKIPEMGNIVCICSSLKDSLCLWANTGIPSIYLQGEGYKMSNTAINELSRRYKNIYILLDNDEPGLKMAQKLSEDTGFINVVLPHFEEGKDVSDLFKCKGKEEFQKIINNIITINN